MSLCAQPGNLEDEAKHLQQRRRAHKLKRRALIVMNEEQRVTVCRSGVTQIYAMLRTSPHRWRNYLHLARSVIAHLDATTFMRQARRTAEQVWMIAGLQQLAHMDDTASVSDITSWCTRQWLEIAQREANNITALRGIAQSWLHRVQPVLARIHRTESSSSSSGGGSQLSNTSRSTDTDGRPGSDPRTEVERRMDTQDYVEARQYLQPATEYLERAVNAATAQSALTGELLVSAAEAFMSFGNVSSLRNNEGHFRRALDFLRTASSIEGYTLPPHLQQYLDEYGRLMD